MEKNDQTILIELCSKQKEIVDEYEKFIQQSQQKEITSTLQIIQQNHKKHVMIVEKFIQDYQTKVPNHSSFLKNILDQFHSSRYEEQHIIIEALARERKWLKQMNESVNDLSDKEAKAMITHMIHAVEKHIELLLKWTIL